MVDTKNRHMKKPTNASQIKRMESKQNRQSTANSNSGCTKKDFQKINSKNKSNQLALHVFQARNKRIDN